MIIKSMWMVIRMKYVLEQPVVYIIG